VQMRTSSTRACAYPTLSCGPTEPRPQVYQCSSGARLRLVHSSILWAVLPSGAGSTGIKRYIQRMRSVGDSKFMHRRPRAHGPCAAPRSSLLDGGAYTYFILPPAQSSESASDARRRVCADAGLIRPPVAKCKPSSEASFVAL
jgi:hypothetical protein